MNFRSIFKSLPETTKSDNSPPIKESELLSHFAKLHSSPNQDRLQQQNIREQLKTMENSKTKFDELNFSISSEEVLRISKMLKNKKASASDLIKTEMIKASCDLLLDVYKNLFNIILQSGIYPNNWCDGLKTTILKSDDNTVPGNYRGIYVSSGLGKSFSSIINQRLVEFIEIKKICFLKNNRTADHTFSLRKLIEKYSHHHNQKVYTCFVDFKKLFDSF